MTLKGVWFQTVKPKQCINQTGRKRAFRIIQVMAAARYPRAVESTRRLEGGNVELRKTISRRGDSQLIVAVILFVATFGILFLDWLSG